MGLNKFITKKGRVLLDLSGDSVTPETLQKGTTAHDRSGEPIVGKMEVVEEVPTQEKTVDVTDNGTVVIEPDQGHTMTKVTANVNVPKDGVDKIQRYIELQGNTAQNLFRNFTGTSVDELMDGLDTSNVTGFNYMFRDCKQITTVPFFDTSNATYFNSMFEGCSALITIPLFNGQKVTSYSCMFMDCSSLTTVPALDTRATTNLASTFSGCKALTECWIRNMKVGFVIGSGTSYGHLLTLESLLHLCKECRNTGRSLKLTMGTTNLEKLANVYVKLIDITDEMRAEDDLIDEKSPFVVCESTDEGAMLVSDYMATKMWQLA